MRITKRDLEVTLKRLNLDSKRLYEIDGAYGKVKLVVRTGDYGGIRGISFLQTKSELYDIMHSILNYLDAEKEIQ